MNRDLAVTTDFRTVMSEIVYDHMKLHPDKKLFPGRLHRRLGLFA